MSTLKLMGVKANNGHPQKRMKALTLDILAIIDQFNFTQQHLGVGCLLQKAALLSKMFSVQSGSWFLKQEFLVDWIQTTSNLKDGCSDLYAHMPLNNVWYKSIASLFQSMISLVICLFHLSYHPWLALRQHLRVLFSLESRYLA